LQREGHDGPESLKPTNLAEGDNINAFLLQGHAERK